MGLLKIDYRIWTLVIGGQTKEARIHFRLDAVRKRAILWLGI